MREYKFDIIILLNNLILWPIFVIAAIFTLIENHPKRKGYWKRHLLFLFGFVYQYPENKNIIKYEMAKK